MLEIIACINNRQVLCLVDLGATRSCVKADEPFLTGTTIHEDFTQIIAANHQVMRNCGCCNITIQLQQSARFPIKPLVIKELSYPVILGMDFIKTIQFNQDQEFAILNGVRVDRYRPGAQKYFGTVISSLILPATSEEKVRVKNPIHHLACKLIEIEPFGKILSTTSKPKFMVNQAVYDNEEYLDIIITNFTHSPIKIHAGYKIFSCRPLNVRRHIINGLKILHDDPNEKAECAEFQKARKAKYFKNGFQPSIGQIGSGLTANQKAELEQLISKKVFGIYCR